MDAGLDGGRVARRRLTGRWRLAALALVSSVAVVAVAVGGWFYRSRSGEPEPLRGYRQQAAPALVAPADPRRGTLDLVDRSGPEDGIVAGPLLSLDISPPADATEMQVGFDPSFASARWEPVAESTELTTDDVGYQIVFGRFRPGPEGEPSPVSTDGITVDPTHAAAVASADGLHRPSWVRPVGPDRLMVRIEGGRIVHGAQESYDFDRPPSGDSVDRWFGPVNVRRDGEPYGIKVEGSEGLLRQWDRLHGRAVDPERLDDGLWLVIGPDGREIGTTAVERISRAGGGGFGPDGRIVALVHDVVLTLDEPIEVGAAYRLQPPVDVADPYPFSVDWATTRSPAVHVNQHGYAPDDPLKVGYLSRPFFATDGLEPYRADLPFTVRDEQTGAVAFTGSLRARPGGDELDGGDLTGAPVFEADFSGLDRPGRYRLCIDTVGCSTPFAVDEQVWDELVRLVARAMYHQRSGVALGRPHTPVLRPRAFHPEDGKVVRESELTLLEAFEQPLGDVFAELVAARTDVVRNEAWGGHFDAGDWDRRIQHLYYVRSAIELVELDPERWASTELQLPESGDAVPDLLDEALWSLDLFRRLQEPDGGVSGGVETSEHPRPDNTSWSDDLAVFSYAPDPWSSYLYAGVAAQMAVVLAPYDAERAADYGASAQAAAEWALTAPHDPIHADGVRNQQAVAAAALYRLTGERRWHDLFVEASALDDEVDAFLSCHAHAACDAGWIYLRTDPALTDPDVRALIETSFVASADRVLAAAETTAYGWAVENEALPLVWGLGPGGSPSAIGLLRAHRLTGDDRYRSAALRSASVSLGANPTNTVYLTGVGSGPVRHPLIVDVLHGGLPVWPGTPIYGPHRLNLLNDESWVEEFILEPAGVQPLPSNSPFLWQFQDIPHVAMFTEYTVFQSHGEALYAYGLLAAG